MLYPSPNNPRFPEYKIKNKDSEPGFTKPSKLKNNEIIPEDMVLSQILGASQDQQFNLRPKNKSQIRNRVGSRLKRRNSINNIFDNPETGISNQSFKRKLSDNASSLRMKSRRQTSLCQIKESKFGKDKVKKNSSGISQHEHQEVSF